MVLPPCRVELKRLQATIRGAYYPCSSGTPKGSSHTLAPHSRKDTGTVCVWCTPVPETDAGGADVDNIAKHPLGKSRRCLAP